MGIIAISGWQKNLDLSVDAIFFGAVIGLVFGCIKAFKEPKDEISDKQRKLLGQMNDFMESNDQEIGKFYSQSIRKVNFEDVNSSINDKKRMWEMMSKNAENCIQEIDSVLVYTQSGGNERK
ncbi:MAG TPA: hypothetical protein IAB23_08600 [Candidatus Scybalocola faecavium]|nr:hypothetical protein [Candidatus Scybalocola faecavium]